ncbi:hypothetical protein [Microseira wollei]|uniref:Uncharacterized protein n=1 Tax=Microseira wollei NIES-4236 TaxID=2530354 RepID=A0AAV3XHQ7_9CYAN|nr:hypothetical protein [Microseira wollei]GET41435.1 hypothetical protein MiSe_62470 [Microseira wollei NIES-4236]
METWEFLLQRQGEATWHTLAPQAMVEIQQGRYRLAVRSSYTDTEVDVRITHDSTYEDPPKRRMQKHARSTNADGLMVVIPFNYLKPGSWEFRCRPDLITDLMGNTWQHTLQIQVLPDSAPQAQQVRVGAGEQVSGGGGSVIKQTKRGSLDAENSSNISDAIRAAAQAAANAQEVVVSDTTTSESTTSPEARESPQIPTQVEIALDNDTYVARQDGVLTVSGQVESAAAVGQPIPGTELQIYLRDPQNSQVVAERQQMLPAGNLPVRFTCKVNIPPQVNTRLILGEIALKVAGETPAPQVLTTASFTVTADVTALLSAIANNSATNLFDIAPDAPAAPIDPLDTPKEVPTIQFEPSDGVPIPPLLNKSTLRQKPRQPLELPTFPSRYPPKPKPKPEPVSTKEEQDQAEDTTEADISLDAFGESELAVDLSAESNNGTTPAESDEHPSIPETSSIVHIRPQERLFSRLEALATDEELSDWLKAAPSLDPLTIDLDSLFDIHPEPDAHLTAGEFVVDDEPIKPRRKKGEQKPKPDFDPVPEDEPIPTPKLEVFPNGELTSGQKVRVRVTLAYGLPRLGVKLWIVDRQTRSLLEEPRLLGDFAPNGWGQVEAISQVTVPFGCLEMRFEAIATEIQTKRESHKVTIDRTVLPPDLPTIPLDEFDL